MRLRFILGAVGILAAVAVSGCFRPDHRTITVSVPQMGGPPCFAEIQKALSSVEGIEAAKPDYDKRTVDVSYNALKLGIKNIEFVIAGAGFDANDTRAADNVRTNLPEACR